MHVSSTCRYPWFKHSQFLMFAREQNHGQDEQRQGLSMYYTMPWVSFEHVASWAFDTDVCQF